MIEPFTCTEGGAFRLYESEDFYNDFMKILKNMKF